MQYNPARLEGAHVTRISLLPAEEDFDHFNSLYSEQGLDSSKRDRSML